MIKSYWLSAYNIIIFSILGAIFGFFSSDFMVFIKPLGDFFIQCIKMLIVPLIIFSVLNATARLAETNKAGKIGAYSILYFLLTSIFAVVLGLIFSIMFNLGLGVGKTPEYSAELIGEYSALSSISEFIMNLVPINPIKSFSEGNIIQILVFTIFLGIALSYIKNQYRDTFVNNLSVLNDSFIWMIEKVMYLTPIGVFSLLGYAVATMGVDVLSLMIKFLLVYILVCFIMVYIFYGFLVKFFSKLSYIQFFKGIIPLKIISFSTSSSLVSLPTNIKNCTDLGLNKNILNFVLPIGATINMNGSAMFYAMAGVFCANVFGVELSLSSYIAIAITSILAAIGTAGVPGATLLVVIVFSSANIPLEGIPLILAMDRVFDMFRTPVNVIGDSTCVALLDEVIAEDKSK